MSLYQPIMNRSSSSIIQQNDTNCNIQRQPSLSPNFHLFLNTNNATTSSCGSATSTPLSISDLSRRGSTVDDCGRFCALPQFDGIPEVLISLCFLDDQSKIVIVIEKATGLHLTQNSNHNLSNTLTTSTSNHHTNFNKSFDTSLRISMLSSNGVELAKHKSDIIKGCGVEPICYNESAVFQLIQGDLESHSLLVQVYSQSSILRRKIFLGWVLLGSGNNKTVNNSLNEAAQQHWEEMIQGTGITVDKWHRLIRTPFQYLQTKSSV